MSPSVKLTHDVPVVAEVDVLVAGAGIAGCLAALAAAREGAKTMLVDRFGYLGGNMGPGMFSGGVLHLALGHDFAQLERVPGLVGEFLDRCEGYADHLLGKDYFKDSQVVAYVWQRLMDESGVQLMLNTYAGQPIMEGNTVTGVVIENRDGTQAVRAKVVIDTTGDCGIGERAGAEMFQGDRYVHPGMYFAIAGVDAAKWLAYRDSVQVSEEDVKWAQEVQAKLGAWGAGSLKPLFPMMRSAWRVGEYRFIKPIGNLGAVTIDHGYYRPMRDIVGAQVGVADNRLNPASGKPIDSGSHAVMQELELGCRQYIFESAQFMRRHAPGFENSHLHMIAPYFHARGTVGMVCEYKLTKEEAVGCARFDDVVFLTYENNAPESYDFPYRQLVPKGVNGLLAAGKSAIIDPPSNRARWKMLVMGQAAGVAAAQAAREGVTPSKIDVRQLQRTLHSKYHMPLGTPERLNALGLAAM
jgi:hypothetical protein